MLRAFFLLRTSLFAAVWNPKANSATAWFGECWRFGSAGGIEVGEINKMVGYWFHEVQLFTVELLVISRLDIQCPTKDRINKQWHIVELHFSVFKE